jgi:hypothetical protein
LAPPFFFCEFAVFFCVEFLILQKQPCHCCISALAGVFGKQWLAGWLAGLFMKQLACHLHWDWHSTDSNAKLFEQLPIDHHA